MKALMPVIFTNNNFSNVSVNNPVDILNINAVDVCVNEVTGSNLTLLVTGNRFTS